MASLRFTFETFSTRVAGLLTLAHGMAISSVFVVDWSMTTKMCMALAVLASWGFCLLHNIFRRLPYSVADVLLKSDGSMEVTRHNGTVIGGRQMPGGFIHPWFTAIRWRPDDGWMTRSIAVFPGSLSIEQCRQLRIWLKWRRASRPQVEGGM